MRSLKTPPSLRWCLPRLCRRGRRTCRLTSDREASLRFCPRIQPRLENPSESRSATAPITMNPNPNRDFTRTIRPRDPNPFDVAEKFDQLGLAEQEEMVGGGGINFGAYDDIPVETSGMDVPAPVTSFVEIDLGDALNRNIAMCKYVKPTSVQRRAIPILLARRDLMACAQTGSGKTAAFCFVIICGFMRDGLPQQRGYRGLRTSFPLALILSPTRVLTSQIH